ncbi:MAG: hypothetical protein JWQ18_633 [Conexibacter sp.]|nr:hypothetical protein [Conexibacter sp.]
MAPRRDDLCGARFRRDKTEPEPHVPETEELGLTGLGAAFIDLLRDDERFRDVIADPFGEQQDPAAKG